MLAVLGQTTGSGMLESEVGGGREGACAVRGRSEFLDPAVGPLNEGAWTHDGDVLATERRQDDRQQTHVVEQGQPGDAA